MAYVFFICTCVIWLIVELILLLRDRRIKIAGGSRGGRCLYYLIVIAVILCSGLSYIDIPFAKIDATAGLLTGTVVVWAGLFLRWQSIKTLGKYFHVVVTVQDGQKVIDKGPYKYVRHPSYLGSLIICTGVGLGFGDWIGLLVVLVLSFISFSLRIQVEEQIMTSSFGNEYLSYMRRTNRLIPFLY